MTVLAWLAVTGAGATIGQRLVFALFLGVVYGASYLCFCSPGTRRTHMIGYKG